MAPSTTTHRVPAATTTVTDTAGAGGATAPPAPPELHHVQPPAARVPKGDADDRPTVLLDGRWWTTGGTGAFTRSLVRGLGRLDPDERWLLWGPQDVRGAAWPGAEHVGTEVRPAAGFGQRQAFRVPRADLVLHPHQTRPAHLLPAASCVLDLIQLRHEDPLVRRAMRLRLAATVARAQVLFTIAPSVRDELVATFGVDPAAVTVLHLPVDERVAAEVRARRALADEAGHGGLRRSLLAVGRFAPHKNQRRLVEAFAATRFAATGGELHLVGGRAEELGLDPHALPRGVQVRGHLAAHELEAELADAVAVVQPSLVEGYGLPVAEALAAGVPVVSSPVPAATELGPPGLPTFDPTSTADMAEVIDATVDLVEEDRYWTRVDLGAWRRNQPDDVDLAMLVRATLAPHLAASRAHRRGRR